MLPIIHITSDFFLPTYLVIISLVYSFGVLWIVRRAQHKQLDRNYALDLCLAIMIGGFISARLFHVFYEAFPIYQADPWRFFRFWEGGFVFYGGAIGGALSCLAILRWRHLPFGPWSNLFAPVLAAGYALGRLGCLSAGCCYGAATKLPWGITFPPGALAPAGIARHPTQIYAFLWEGLLCLGLLYLEKRSNSSTKSSPRFFSVPGVIFFIWLGFHGLGRLIMESCRADDRGLMLGGQSVSTWLSLIVITAAISALVFLKKRAPSNG